MQLNYDPQVTLRKAQTLTPFNLKNREPSHRLIPSLSRFTFSVMCVNFNLRVEYPHVEPAATTSKPQSLNLLLFKIFQEDRGEAERRIQFRAKGRIFQLFQRKVKEFEKQESSENREFAMPVIDNIVKKFTSETIPFQE